MIARRTVLMGIAGLPLAAALARPAFAQAAAEKTRLVTIKTPSGREVAAALARPEKLPAPAVLLVHEWWGLNDQMKTVARDYADQGYFALAVDLYNGRVTADPQEARALMQKVDAQEATETLQTWVQWLKNHDETTRQVATIGYCFGGHWSLRTGIAAPVDAVVVYYGNVDLPADQLAKLEGPVLGHFGTQDPNINRPMVEKFEKAMAEAKQPLTTHWYDAKHAFSTEGGANYNAEAAKLARQRTLEFLERTIRAA